MERDELERWLCGPDVPPAPPCVIATALGLPTGRLSDTTLLRVAHRVRALRLTLAVLRDAFADDADVSEWLASGHDGLAGLSPIEAIQAGREDDVADLAITLWNEAACIGNVA